MRDRIAWRLANLVLRLIATREYRDRLERCVRRGLAAPATGGDGNDR